MRNKWQMWENTESKLYKCKVITFTTVVTPSWLWGYSYLAPGPWYQWCVLSALEPRSYRAHQPQQGSPLPDVKDGKPPNASGLATSLICSDPVLILPWDLSDYAWHRSGKKVRRMEQVKSVSVNRKERFAPHHYLDRGWKVWFPHLPTGQGMRAGCKSLPFPLAAESSS